MQIQINLNTNTIIAVKINSDRTSFAPLNKVVQYLAKSPHQLSCSCKPAFPLLVFVLAHPVFAIKFVFVFVCPMFIYKFVLVLPYPAFVFDILCCICAILHLATKYTSFLACSCKPA